MVNRQFGGFSRQVHLESQVRTFVSTKPTMKKTRLVGTALSLFLGLAAFYFSLFYLPAYVNQSSIARVTSHERVSPSLDVLGTPVQWYSPYIDLLRLRRGYFHGGQTIEVKYILADHSQLTLKAQRCRGPIIIEIFKCDVANEIVHVETEHKQGKIFLTLPDAGFYRLSESVIKPDGRLGGYSIVWRRR